MDQGRNPVDFYSDSEVSCDLFVLQFGNSGGPLINLVSHSSGLNVDHHVQISPNLF